MVSIDFACTLQYTLLECTCESAENYSSHPTRLQIELDSYLHNAINLTIFLTLLMTL